MENKKYLVTVSLNNQRMEIEIVAVNEADALEAIKSDLKFTVESDI